MIFVSHAWFNDEPDMRVLSFVNYLRENGYDAKCDVMFQQEETAIDFPEMMAKALLEAEKIVVVLSENYKRKADAFQGGVGNEYRYILTDLPANPQRYILVAFDGRNNNIVPDSLKGRDILELKEDFSTSNNALFSKLSGKKIYEFAQVGSEKTMPVAINLNCKNNTISGQEAKISLLKKMLNIKTDYLGDQHFTTYRFGFYDFLDALEMPKLEYERLLKDMRHENLIDIDLNGGKSFDHAVIHAKINGATLLIKTLN